MTLGGFLDIGFLTVFSNVELHSSSVKRIIKYRATRAYPYACQDLCDRQALEQHFGQNSLLYRQTVNTEMLKNAANERIPAYLSHRRALIFIVLFCKTKYIKLTRNERKKNHRKETTHILHFF